MVVDTSVLIMVLFQEDGWEKAASILRQEERKLFSTASLIEAQAVISGKRKISNEEALERLDNIVADLELDVVPLTIEQSRIAREAYLKYGRGKGHKAGLNYGDVMSYALAKDTGEKLAFVGDDFQHTDLKVLRLPL